MTATATTAPETRVTLAELEALGEAATELLTEITEQLETVASRH
ncbi:hypothetical protein [Amycolatopsis sp. NPDC051128]